MKESHLITAIVSVLIAVIGLAAIAVLVSSGAQTGNVLTSGSGAFTNIICAALRPIGVNCGSTTLTPSVNSTITFPS